MAELAAVAGIGLAAKGQKDAGKEGAESLYAEARMLQRNAGLRRATSQRDANDERKLGKLAASQALAIAASQGGASDPTVQKLIAELETEGEYRALQRMWSGEAEARQMELEAKYAKRAGKATYRSGRLAAAATILSGGARLSQVYG